MRVLRVTHNLLYVYMYIEQTKPHMINSLLYCSLFIALNMFQGQRVILRSSHSVPAKLHKRVRAVLVVFFKTSIFVS